MTMLHEDFVDFMLIGGSNRQILREDAPTDSTDSVSTTNRYLRDWTPNPVSRKELEKEINERMQFSDRLEMLGPAN
ncbi:hypothetical protein BJX64DRAFT_13915 [Aspergillus heterothallicus]